MQVDSQARAAPTARAAAAEELLEEPAPGAEQVAEAREDVLRGEATGVAAEHALLDPGVAVLVVASALLPV